MASPTNPSLQSLLRHPDIWRLSERGRLGASKAGIGTGFAGLDTVLHEGGWPRAALTELLTGQAGIGELQLVLPALVERSRQQLWQIWINPPFIPYAPVLARAGIDLDTLLIVRTEPRQQLWTCEQALRCAAVGAVLFWPALALRYAELRKLQVAAGAQQSLAFLFRGKSNAMQTSPAALRLQLDSVDNQLAVQILKQRGGRGGQQILLPRSPLLQAQSPLSMRAAVTRGAPAAILQVPDNLSDGVPRPRALVPIPKQPALRRSGYARGERHVAH